MTAGHLTRGLAVVAGGAAGTAIRLAVAEAVPPGWLPWATLSVNLAGAGLLGLMLATLLRHARGPWALLIGVGLLGGLTTFSTFVGEVDGLIAAGRSGAAVAYLLVSVVGGLAAARAGMVAGGAHR